MNLYLTRFGSIPGQGTFGEILAGDLIIKTVEREWLDNKPFVSCIPSGAYQIIPHTRPNGDAVYAIVNESLGVYRYPNPKAVRDLILIHKANVMTELAGCIAPGTRHGAVDGHLGVYNSGKTMTKLQNILGKENHTLHINWRHL